jgi:RNA-directed DNA polymerase
MKRNRKKNYESVTVPFSATPAEKSENHDDSIAIGDWAHPSVWTDRTLNTPEVGVRGGKWHTLIDKVFSKMNLYASARKVLKKKGSPGVDRQTVEDFADDERMEINRLAEQLREDRYRPSAVRRTWISKPGSSEKRPLGIPTVRDRAVQTAVVHVIEPILDATFHDRSFGFRRGRSSHDALRVVEEKLDAGYVYVVDADLKGYFDTIPKDRLMDLVREEISDRRMLELIEKFLDQSIMEELKEWTPDSGVPQGAVLSPVLSNLYLNGLDHLMAESGYEMVRYADDFVILCRSQDEAEAALEMIRDWVTTNGLTLHPTKTHIVDAREKSFDFLGYSFRGRFRFPRKKSHQKLTARICELTPRKSGQSLECTIKQINRVLRGWFHYFRHCFWNIYGAYDSMIRRRLRRLLEKRHRRNPKRLPRNQRWPNSYFAEHGLLSLQQLHVCYVQSLQGNN